MDDHLNQRERGKVICVCKSQSSLNKDNKLKYEEVALGRSPTFSSGSSEGICPLSVEALKLFIVT